MIDKRAWIYYMDQQEPEYEEQSRRQVVHEMNGHFLFNALSVIMVMTRKKPSCAGELEKDFSDYLRGAMTMAGGEQGWVPLSLELRVVRAYLHIQSVRFMGKISYEVSISNEEALVPSGVLRCLVENAVSHGICRKGREGYVYIEQQVIDNRHFISVTDNGVGFDTSILKDIPQGGIARVRSVLEQIKGAGLEIYSAPGCGTQAELILPFRI